VLAAFGLAGLVCLFAALCYAELAATAPAAGSAYSYAYATLGEGLAWIVGWSLLLEYSVVCSAVAVGWSVYAVDFLSGSGLPLPQMFTAGPQAGGFVNVPAILIVALVAGALAVGVRESARVNAVLVVIKIAALAIFVAFAAPAFDLAHFSPFAPHGLVEIDAEGAKLGILPAASIMFFAFYGFDAVSTAAEEVERPDRDLAIGIVGSMAICTMIYMVVGAAAIGALPASDLAASKAPLADVLRHLGHPTVAAIVSAAAVVALPTVILAFLFGQSRIFFVMARDGLLPRVFASVDARTGAPGPVTVATAVFIAALAGLAPLNEIAALANAGTLVAFMAVGASLIALRRIEPYRPRPFRAPLGVLCGLACIAGCVYLFSTLPERTHHFFLAAQALGLVVYAVVLSARARAKGSHIAEDR
jgi:APA family basic amino acid/polyamine antiporter